MVPLLGLVFWYLKRMGLTDQWISSIRLFILERLNVYSSAEFLQYFDKITKQTKGHSWGWIGILLLVYSATSLISKFGQGLDAVLGLKPKEEKHWGTWCRVWGRRAVGLLGLPLALSVSLYLSQKWGRKVLGFPLISLSNSLSVFFVYYFIPSKRPPVRKCIQVALMVGPLLEVLRIALGFYSRYAVSVHKMYGVFAVVPLFILWIQLSWALLLAGALGLKGDCKEDTPSKDDYRPQR